MVLSVSEIRSPYESDLTFPPALSFFTPYLSYYIREILRIGGEAYVSRSSADTVSGVFIYDATEKTGTIFTRSRGVFDHFLELKPFDFLFSEIKSEHESEPYDIYTLDLENVAFSHNFRHEISVADHGRVDEVEEFMLQENPRMNRRWVRVAFDDGEKCFVVKLEDDFVGLGWLSIVNGIGRFHSLYVKPQFRGLGIGEDIFFARLLWLKSKHAISAFSEISRENPGSSRIALKGGMKVCGQIFQYFRTSTGPKASKASPKL